MSDTILLPIRRDHLKRLLAAVQHDDAFRDVVDTYTLPDGEIPPLCVPYTPIRGTDGEPVRDTVILDLGSIRIRTFNPDGTPLTPENSVARANMAALEMFVDGQWVQSMSVTRFELPAFDYTSDDAARVKCEFLAYSCGSSWVPAK